jgi:hypothetical protein
MPQALVTDLWEARACFDRHFKRPPRFIYAKDGASVVGLVPLSWIEESSTYGYFPGETWKGRTWLEGNRVVARDGEVAAALLSACPPNVDLRYLLPVAGEPGLEVDEVGYLFSPPRYGYDVERWFEEFSFKNAKRLRRAIGAIEAQGLEVRLDDRDDVGRLVELNLRRFGASSYFHDRRFREGFVDLAAWLETRGWLRVTALLIDGEPAAIDVGAVYRRTYTLLAGGTHREHPGIAKVINLHHLRTACAERYRNVDFLCGEFAWKPLFHLEPRPLCRYAGHVAARAIPTESCYADVR